MNIMAEVKLIIKHKDTFEVLYEGKNVEIKNELNLLLTCKYLKLGGRLFHTDHENTTYEEGKCTPNISALHNLIIYAVEVIG